MNPETLITTTWPTIGATTIGRWVGQLSGMRFGWGFFRLGKIWAVATIPVSLTVFFWQLMPWICRRYTLTNQRAIIQLGLSATNGPAVGLNDFDEIAVEILPGQAWLHAGDLVFRSQGKEVLRFAGVVRPEIFRQTCLKAQAATLIGRPLPQRSTAVAS